jgi:putative acetyltransferase
MAQDLQIALAPTPTNEVSILIAELNNELSALYTPEQRHGLSLEAIFQPHIRFFVARIGDESVGCGGIALFDGFAEIKRMYVRPKMRGRGIADAIVARLAKETVNSGRKLLRLETGSHSFAAKRFYSRCGFRLCEAFEPYAFMPPPAIITSVFMEKEVGSDHA